MMKYMKEKHIYLAGKLNSDEGSVEAFAEELEAAGHTVMEKWWSKEALPTPYLENRETSSRAAAAMITAAYECDVFVLFARDNILGAAVELGAAIASAASNPEKVVIVNGAEHVRQSVFYAHPAVIAINSLKELRAMDWVGKRHE